MTPEEKENPELVNAAASKLGIILRGAGAKKEILSEFRKFLYCNGFPEMVNENEEVVSLRTKVQEEEKRLYIEVLQEIYYAWLFLFLI